MSLRPLEVAANVVRLQHIVHKQQELIDRLAEEHTSGEHVELCEHSKTSYEVVTALHGALVTIPQCYELIEMADLDVMHAPDRGPDEETIKEKVAPLVTLMEFGTSEQQIRIGDALFHLMKRGDSYKKALVKAGAIPVLLRIAQQFSDILHDRGVRGATASLVSLVNEFPTGVRLVMENDVGAKLARDMLVTATSPDQVRLSMELICNLAHSNHAETLQKLGVMTPLIQQADKILHDFPYHGYNFHHFRDACFNAIKVLCIKDKAARMELVADLRCVGVIAKMCALEDANETYADVGAALIRSVLHFPSDLTLGLAKKLVDAGTLETLVKWIDSESKYQYQKNNATRAIAMLIRDGGGLQDQALQETALRQCLLFIQGSNARLIASALLLLGCIIHNNQGAAMLFREMRGLEHMKTVIDKIDSGKTSDLNKQNGAAYLSFALCSYAATQPLAAWEVANGGFMDGIARFAKSDVWNVNKYATAVLIELAHVVSNLPASAMPAMPTRKRKRPPSVLSEDEE